MLTEGCRKTVGLVTKRFVIDLHIHRALVGGNTDVVNR